jgi:hypothetical protein
MSVLQMQRAMSFVEGSIRVADLPRLVADCGRNPDVATPRNVIEEHASNKIDKACDGFCTKAYDQEVQS